MSDLKILVLSALSRRMICINHSKSGTSPWLPSNNISLFIFQHFSPTVSILVALVSDFQMIDDVPIYIFTGMHFQEAVRQHSATCLLDWRSSNL